MAKIPTVSLILVKKNAQDKEAYIKIVAYVPATNKPKYKSTGYKIPVDAWDKSNERVKRTYAKHGTINHEIEKERDSIIELFEQDLKKQVEFTDIHVQRRLNPAAKVSGDFLQFYREFIALQERRHTAGYVTHLNVEYKTLVDKMGSGIDHSDITTSFLERYELSLSGIKATTLNTKMKRLKDVINRAIDRGHIERKQIAGYRWPAYVQPETEYLTLSEVETISNKIYIGEFDDDIALKTVACYFIIECLSGIRHSDWGRFTIETLLHERNLKVRAKKNGEPIYLPLNVFTSLGRMVDYVKDNRIEFKYTLQASNRILKDLGRKCKIGKNLSTHVGRRTCATLLAELLYSTRDISEILGISENTAKVYVKNTRQGLNNAFLRNGGF